MKNFDYRVLVRTQGIQRIGTETEVRFYSVGTP